MGDDNSFQLIFNIQDYITGGKVLKDEGIICIMDDFSDFK